MRKAGILIGLLALVTSVYGSSTGSGVTADPSERNARSSEIVFKALLETKTTLPSYEVFDLAFRGFNNLKKHSTDLKKEIITHLY